MGLFSRKENAAMIVEEERFSISSPAAAAFFSLGTNYSGEAVSETTALNLSAVWRAVNLISGTMASLPLITYRQRTDGDEEEVGSFLDNPAGPDGCTPFEWKETVFLHLALHGEAFLMHIYGGAGQIVGLYPIHPYSVQVEWADGVPENRLYRISMMDGTQQVLTSRDLTHVVGPCTDGLRGMSPLTMGRNSIGMGLAGERSAATMFRNGALVAGVLTPGADEDLSVADVEAIQQDLRQHVFGTANANTVPIVNRVLQFQPWAMTNSDAQFLESRQFQIEEISRWFGIPPFLLMQLDKSTSWGTGIAEQNKNLVQYVLAPLAERLCSRLSRLLPAPRYVAFDFAELESGSATDLSNLLLSQVNGGLITANEARAKLKLPPVDGGDALRIPSGVMLSDQLTAAAEIAQNEAEAPVSDVTPTPEGTI